MNTKTIFAAFAMFALGIACTPSEPEVEETVSQKVTATVVDNGAATAWTKSDVLGVYTDASENNVKYTAASAGTSVSFTAATEVKGTPKYAYYPYSEVNNNVSHTEVKLSMPIYREYHSTYKDLVGDFRAGVLDSRNWYSSTFTFNRVVALYRFKVNVAGTPLVNSNIRTISIKVNNKRQITGDFKLNLADQTISLGEFVEGNDSLTLKWSSEPTLRDHY